MQTLLLASILLPYAVLIPYIVSLTEHIKQRQKEAPTPNSSPSNVVIYLPPANGRDRNNSLQVFSLQPVFLALCQTKSGNTVELAVGSEVTSVKNISLPLPQGGTIIIQSSASKDETSRDTRVVGK